MNTSTPAREPNFANEKEAKMTRHPVRRLVFAAVALAAVLLPAIANAQAIIKVNDDVWFRFGIQLQGWADWNQSAATSTYAQNLYLRRDRFLVTGSVAPGVTFFFQTDQPNLGKAPKAFGTGFVVQDAWMEWKICDAFAIDAGKYLVPLSRNELQSTVSFLTLDISPSSTVFLAPTGTDATRDTGVEFKGYLGDGGHLEYRASAQQGLRNLKSNNAFRYSGYLQYDFFDTERGYVYAGTNLGKKKILALSGGYDAQEKYKAYSGDIFTNLPVGVGDEFGGQYQFVHYDGGTFIPTLPRQNTHLVELAYYISAAKFQPFGKFEQDSFASLKADDIKRFGGGFHYYVYGQNLKLSAQYLRIMPKSPIKDTNEFTLAMQVFYN
jgi:hypothetical protein